ncbi:Ubiquitin-like protease family profile domain-containing protein [Plasmodiophora brassicae]
MDVRHGVRHESITAREFLGLTGCCVRCPMVKHGIPKVGLAVRALRKVCPRKFRQARDRQPDRNRPLPDVAIRVKTKDRQQLRRPHPTADVPGKGNDGHQLRRLKSIAVVRVNNDDIPVKVIGRVLSPGQWIPDEIVNAYLYLCAKRSSRRIVAISSFLLASITERWRAPNRHRWTRRVDWNAVDIALVPIHVPSRMHWVLAVVDISEHAISALDSLPGQALPKEVFVLARYMRSEMAARMGDKRPWSTRPWHCAVPTQMNGDDCGVFVCEFARRVALRRRIDRIRPDRMDRVRSKIKEELLVQPVM